MKLPRSASRFICVCLLACPFALGELQGVNYPNASSGFRGLESHTSIQVQNLASVERGGMSPDEVTLSQDLTTLGLPGKCLTEPRNGSTESPHFKQRLEYYE